MYVIQFCCVSVGLHFMCVCDPAWACTYISTPYRMCAFFLLFLYVSVCLSVCYLPSKYFFTPKKTSLALQNVQRHIFSFHFSLGAPVPPHLLLSLLISMSLFQHAKEAAASHGTCHIKIALSNQWSNSFRSREISVISLYLPLEEEEDDLKEQEEESRFFFVTWRCLVTCRKP